MQLRQNQLSELAEGFLYGRQEMQLLRIIKFREVTRQEAEVLVVAEAPVVEVVHPVEALAAEEARVEAAHLVDPVVETRL